MTTKVKSVSPLPKKDNKVVQLSFLSAISGIIAGRKVRRLEWSDPEEYCLLKDNFLMIHRNGEFHTWIISEGDLMATDWVIVK